MDTPLECATIINALGVFDGVERTIDVHIYNLRKKLEPDPATPRYLLTVFGMGYRFTDEVKRQ